MTDDLTRLAAEQQRQFDATTLPGTRRKRGKFRDGPAIADFMAGHHGRSRKGQSWRSSALASARFLPPSASGCFNSVLAAILPSSYTRTTQGSFRCSKKP